MSALKLSEGPAITPKDILSLPRPSAALVNPAGTLAVWPSTEFDFKSKRTERSIYLVDLTKSGSSDAGEDFGRTADPKAVLSSLAFTETAWLDDHTIAFLRAPVPHGETAAQGANGERIDHPKDVNDADFTKAQAAASEKEGGKGSEVWAKDVKSGDEYCIGRLPVQ